LLPFDVDWPLYEDYPRERRAQRLRQCLSVPAPSPSPEEFVPEPHHRIVLAIGRALLERDERIVGDLDVLGADLGAALGDVAEAQPVLLLRLHGTTVERVQRMHIEFGLAHQVARARERLLVLFVITHHVAGVLAQEALDALAELL